jgi:succinate dehydrogenase / fumarate reductase membrane anchor subunit
MDYRTPLAKVRGLGSAHNGVGHWWLQRISSIMLIPLSFWPVVYAKHLLTATHAQISAWLTEPLNSFFAITWLLTVFYHAALGLQVVIEDYVHTEWRKITTRWLVKLSFFALALVTILNVLRIILGSQI